MASAYAPCVGSRSTDIQSVLSMCTQPYSRMEIGWSHSRHTHGIIWPSVSSWPPRRDAQRGGLSIPTRRVQRRLVRVRDSPRRQHPEALRSSKTLGEASSSSPAGRQGHLIPSVLHHDLSSQPDLLTRYAPSRSRGRELSSGQVHRLEQPLLHAGAALLRLAQLSWRRRVRVCRSCSSSSSAPDRVKASAERDAAKCASSPAPQAQETTAWPSAGR